MSSLGTKHYGGNQTQLPERNPHQSQGKHSGRKMLARLAAVYLLLSALAIGFNRIYALFAHGVASPYMGWMFLFPLLGGALLYGFVALAAPGLAQRAGWRVGMNLYNAGIATLTAGSLLNGIFEIAGTASPHTRLFFIAGSVLMLAGAACWLKK